MERYYELKQMCDRLMLEKPIEKHPFFIKLKSKELTKAEFVKSQESFIHVINSWSQLHGLLLSKLHKVRHRIYILNNLWDEHGHGIETNSHIKNYHRYLRSMNSDLRKFPEVSPEIKTFVKKIYLIADNAVHLISVMAVIEYAYITVSKLLRDELNKKGWLRNTEEKNPAFEDRHANNLFAVLEDFYDPIDPECIEYGFEYGFDIFYDLYTNMYDMYFANSKQTEPNEPVDPKLI